MKTATKKTFRITSTATGSVVADHEIKCHFNSHLGTWAAIHPRFGAQCHPDAETAARQLIKDAGRVLIRATEVEAIR